MGENDNACCQLFSFLLVSTKFTIITYTIENQRRYENWRQPFSLNSIVNRLLQIHLDSKLVKDRLAKYRILENNHKKVNLNEKEKKRKEKRYWSIFEAIKEDLICQTYKNE